MWHWSVKPFKGFDLFLAVKEGVQLRVDMLGVRQDGVIVEVFPNMG